MKKKNRLTSLLNEANDYVEAHKTGKVSQRPLIILYKDEIIKALQNGYSKKAIYHSMVKLNIISCTYISFLKHTNTLLNTQPSSESTTQIPDKITEKTSEPITEPIKPQANHFNKGFKFNPIVDEKELFGD